ncbi:MAG: helix-turn-helix transcriptional regulator, partial [Actinomycetota bacterium]
MTWPLTTSDGIVLAHVDLRGGHRAWSLDAREPGVDPKHHRLVWSRRGVAAHVSVGSASYLVYGGDAVWVPVERRLEVRSAMPVGSAWFEARSCPALWSRSAHLTLDRAVVALLEWLPAQVARPWAEHVASAVVEEIAVAHSRTPAALPMPADAGLRDVATALIADPSIDRDIAAWADIAGYSERTFRRRFVTETNWSFARWRRELRMRTAMSLLADGVSVSATARRSGYASTTSLARAFKDALGLPPSRFQVEGGADRPALWPVWPQMREVIGEAGEVTFPPFGKRTSQPAATLAAVGLMLLAAACGTDTDDPSSSIEPTAETAETAEAAETAETAGTAGTAGTVTGDEPEVASSEPGVEVESADGDELSADGGDAFPVTIEHPLGSTLIDQRPERVLAVTDQQELSALLALDVVPTAWGQRDFSGPELPWLAEAGAYG